MLDTSHRLPDEPLPRFTVEQLRDAFRTLVEASTWADARTVLEQRPELLSEQIDEVVHEIALEQDTPDGQQAVEEYRDLIRRCREVGIAIAFYERGLDNEDIPIPAEFEHRLFQAQDAAERYQQSGDARDLDEAIISWETILTDSGFPNANLVFRLTVLNNVSAEYMRRYWVAGRLSDLDRAIVHMEEVVAQAPPDSRHLATYLTNLGAALSDRYERTGDLADLERIIPVYQYALNVSPPNAPQRAVISNNLGNGLIKRYDRDGDPGDVVRAIQAYEQAVTQALPGASDLPMYLSNLGSALRERYYQTSDVADLTRSLEVQEQAVALTPPDAPDLPTRLNNLGASLLNRYDRTGDLDDLTRCIAYYERAVRLTPIDAPDRAGRLSNLGVALNKRYLQSGALEDLQRIIEVQEQAVELTPPGAPSHAHRLNSLGARLAERYNLLGDPGDLVRSIKAHEQAVALSPPSAPERARYLTNLGNQLRVRFYQMGDLVDLERSIEAHEQALATTPPGGTDQPGRLANLGMGLRERYQRLGDPADLERAIGYDEQAIALIPSGAPELPIYLVSLGNGLRSRFARSGNQADLARLVECYERAVALTPAQAPALPDRLSSLGIGLSDRYEQTRDPQDLERSIQAHEQALARSSRSAPHRLIIMNNLADGLRMRYDRTGDKSDLKRAIELFEAIARDSRDVVVEIALGSARNWGFWVFEQGNWADAARAFDYALQASERLLKLQLIRRSKESWLREVQSVADHAAYALAKIGDLPGAIVTLERGRARLMAEALGRNRADLRGLQEMHPVLVRRYREIVEHIASMDPQGLSADQAPLQHAEELRAAYQELDETVDAIRRVRGYEQFLQPLSFADIQASVDEAPLVYLLTTRAGGLALLVDNQDLEAIWLRFSALHLDNILFSWNEFDRRFLEGSASNNRRALHTTLDWALPLLGERLIEPLAARLRERNASAVTLVPCGLLSLLPLHAACYPAGQQEHFFLDEYDVSYAPSSRALLSAQTDIRTEHERDPVLAGVGNPMDNPRPLVYARAELEEVAARFAPAARRTLYEHQATKRALFAILPGATYVHLSCHGMFDVQEPLNSHLELAEQEPLMLREILEHKEFRQLRLVVLSACQTAITDFRRLPDESIGLPAGFLQAGASSVIGTLWPVNDLSTALLMMKFYEYHLWGDAAMGFSPMPLARALRYAQRWLRDVTNETLSELFNRYRKAAQDQPHLPYQLAEEKFMEYTTAPRDARPFQLPYYWTPFSFYGI